MTQKLSPVEAERKYQVERTTLAYHCRRGKSWCEKIEKNGRLVWQIEEDFLEKNYKKRG